MSYNITPIISKRIIELRQVRKMTQQELAKTAKLSLRTIQNMEKGRSKRVSEDTLILLCRALDLKIEELNVPADILSKMETTVTNATESPGIQKGQGRWFWVIIFIVGIIGIVITGWILRKDSHPKSIRATQQIGQSKFNWRTPASGEWKSLWNGGKEGIQFNSLEYTRGVTVRDTVQGSFKFSYHYPSSRPAVYANLFCDWLPEAEIYLYSGPITGDSSIVVPFKIVCPSRPGIYRIRAFIALQVASVIDFEGNQIKGQYISNHLPQFVESKIVVLPKRMKDKVVNK